jgi:CAAX protease family protein
MATKAVSRPSTRPLLASTWHTIGFIAIFVGFAILGGVFQHAARQHPQTQVQGSSVVYGYLSVIVFEWLLVLYVRFGIRKRGIHFRDLVGGRWSTLGEILRDIVLGFAIWAVWLGVQRLSLFGHAPNTAQGLLPKGVVESLAWIPVALSAGFCEELAFRGYLQKQFQAILGGVVLAVIFQAIIFGIGHLYEGWAAVARIMIYGVLYGILAAWRRSCRPGMLAHAWSDISGVIIFRGL